MGRIKEILSSLQEAEKALREYDPIAFENAKQIIAAAEAIALAGCTPKLRRILPREDQTEMPL